ncbi:MAG: ferric reductase-like transmembrane domain-containing protein, partial [Chromatiales bacterium]|nr:ferric reductase-like transmembrane domain-containing protein [Chromatiales bacterium]
MRNFKFAFWGGLALLAVLWFVADPTVFHPATFWALRSAMVQFTGVIAIASMSLAMGLALRPRWPETWLGGLDKMYRLHKWLGIAALVASVLHWLWAKAPKWAVGWGWLERPERGPRAPDTNLIESFLRGIHGFAEDIGEWAFYAAVVLIALALIKYFPYRWFYKTHRLLALAYLILVFHTVVLFQFSYWISPIGGLIALLLAAGTWAAVVVLRRRVGADRKVPGQIMALRYFPGVHAL